MLEHDELVTLAEELRAATLFKLTLWLRGSRLHYSQNRSWFPPPRDERGVWTNVSGQRSDAERAGAARHIQHAYEIMVVERRLHDVLAMQSSEVLRRFEQMHPEEESKLKRSTSAFHRYRLKRGPPQKGTKWWDDDGNRGPSGGAGGATSGTGVGGAASDVYGRRCTAFLSNRDRNAATSGARSDRSDLESGRGNGLERNKRPERRNGGAKDTRDNVAAPSLNADKDDISPGTARRGRSTFLGRAMPLPSLSPYTSRGPGADDGAALDEETLIRVVESVTEPIIQSATAPILDELKSLREQLVDLKNVRHHVAQQHVQHPSVQIAAGQSRSAGAGGHSRMVRQGTRALQL